MTVEIISWSISTKVRDRVRIQSRDPWIQTHICCQTRYRLRKRSYWIQPNLFGDLLAQVGEQEHYCFLLFGSPLHGPQGMCIFWLNCSLFLNCWVELNQICAQLKQIVYTRAYFWVPHSEAPYNGDKSVCPFFFYAGVTLSRTWHQMATRIWNFEFCARWPRTWSPANQQPKQLQCLQKVTRWQPNHTRRQHEDVIFYQVTYPQDTRRLHDSYTTSYWEYDAFELGHECVTWSPDGINPL